MSSDKRLVLLGFKDAGKSTAGNTILRGEYFHRKKTVQCVKGEGDVDGRHVIIIKAPGWEKDQLLKETPELMKEEITLSLCLCPPGPHSVLLVMRAGIKFTETSRRAAQEHVELLGNNVWTHTIVLFTHGDWLGERSIEQYIESEGKPLQWLVEKCGNRYHVFSDDKDKSVQVSELFNKVDKTVAGNSIDHFKVDEMTLKAMEKRRNSEKKRAGRIKNKLLWQSDGLHSTGGDSKKSTDIRKLKPTSVSKTVRIVLLGHSNAEKSYVGNSLLGKKAFHSINALQAVGKQGQAAGRQITVVIAPGWGPEQRLSDTPELTRQEIILSVSSCGEGPHVLVLFIRVNKTFTELNRRAVQDHMDLLGPKVWEHTLLVLNCRDGLGDISAEQYIERKGKALHWLAEKCGNRYYVLDNNRSVDCFVKDLLEVVESMIEQNGGSYHKTERDVLQEVVKKREGEMEKAKDRKHRVRKQWEAMRLGGAHKGLEKMAIKDKPREEKATTQEFQIVLLGHRGAGKTAAGNTILGGEAFKGRQNVQSVKKAAEVDGRHVTVIRASDWEKEQLLTDTPELTKQEIMLSLSLCPPGPYAVLVVIRVTLKFTETSRRAVQEHLELLSDKVWNHCMVLFTCEEWLGDITIEQYIECEGKPLQWLIERCGDRYHVLSLKSRKENSQVTELLQKIEHMVTG